MHSKRVLGLGVVIRVDRDYGVGKSTVGAIDYKIYNIYGAGGGVVSYDGVIDIVKELVEV